MNRDAAFRVKTAAAALGFDACGIAGAGIIDPEGRLSDWLACGFHADMGWMVTTADIRVDIRRALPGARSVVVVARNYYSERPAVPNPGGAGFARVARFAWGRDYHRVLLKPLRALARTIRECTGNGEAYVCIDSGPVLERAWAARAGIGWIGKNSLVVREGAGSWFFLGVIATDAVLAADMPVSNRCGNCTRCLDACPTGAIVAPGTVDARRCIAYQTIENRGAIAADVQERMGPWICGCDVCQEVCPWNRFACETTEPDFWPRPALANPDIGAWLEMDEEAFKRVAAGSPVSRAKYAGIQRNLRIAARHTPDTDGPTTG